MTNVQEALKNAIDEINDLVAHIRDREPSTLFSSAELVINKCKAALAEIDKCEPVAQAIRERDRLGFAVVNVMTKLDEIIDTTQEVEIDDFLHIAISIDMWNELQDALEDMPKRADLYTSPLPREWVGLSEAKIESLAIQNKYWYGDNKFDWFAYSSDLILELKQLNTKG